VLFVGKGPRKLERNQQHDRCTNTPPITTQATKLVEVLSVVLNFGILSHFFVTSSTKDNKLLRKIDSNARRERFCALSHVAIHR
jgi:hypothetical protein